MFFSKSNEDVAGWKRRLVRWAWLLFGLGILVVALIFGLLLFDNLPTFEQLENPEINQASIVYSRNGKPFGKYFIENRESVRFKDLNPHLVDALISTEDARYYSHSGIDFTGLGRVFFKTIVLQQRGQGGGSTIDQQLAKLLFKRPNLRGRSSLYKAFQIARTKFKEWLIAIKLNKRYTKEEILAMYLSQFDFLYGAEGVQSAAQTYFGKDQKDLTINEAAMLVGMLKNPSYFNPKRHPNRAKARRDIVLHQMRKAKKIDAKEYEMLVKDTLDMSHFMREVHTEGPAPYFRRELTKWLKDLLAREEYLKPNGEKYDIYRDGLKIYTTIDLKMQQHAEEEMRKHMASVQKRFDRHWGRRDPWKYQATPEQKKIRQNTLNRLVRESERYQKLWNKYFGKLQVQLNTEIGKTSLSARMIKRLINNDKKKRYLDKLVREKQISKGLKDKYLAVRHSAHWKALEQAYKKFEGAVKKDFNTKVKMKIFAYNDKGYKMAEMTPLDSIKYHRNILQIGSLGVDPRTGEVKMWIGGVDFKWFKVDHTNVRRQVGSTFKPFVYITAIALQGLSPCQEFEDKQYIIPANDPNFKMPKPWAPQNANGKFLHTNYNLYQGLLYSKNSISVRLMIEIGSVAPVLGLLHNMGIDSTLRYPNRRYVIPRVPSICLGAADLKVQEMAGAYTTFANNGIYSKPYFVKKIVDKNNQVIYQAAEYHNTAINPQYNYVMVDMLMNNVRSYSHAFPGITCEFGGKTGTTNDYVDSWFMGITPDLVVGTWVGGEDKWIHWLNLNEGQGFVNARPFFAAFIKSITQDKSVEFKRKAKFARPASLDVEIDCDKYKQRKLDLQSGDLDGDDDLLNQDELEEGDMDDEEIQ